MISVQAFSELTECRSIILTSGTLSPLTSFASELGVSFPVHLEANHVIHESQVAIAVLQASRNIGISPLLAFLLIFQTWIKSLSHGPNGVLLSATYQNSEVKRSIWSHHHCCSRFLFICFCISLLDVWVQGRAWSTDTWCVWGKTLTSHLRLLVVRASAMSCYSN